jgi:hypothetical protein
MKATTVSFRDCCEYCYLPFNQGNHEHCLERLRHLRLESKDEQQAVRRQVRFLESKRCARGLARRAERRLAKVAKS